MTVGRMVNREVLCGTSYACAREMLIFSTLLRLHRMICVELSILPPSASNKTLSSPIPQRSRTPRHAAHDRQLLRWGAGPKSMTAVVDALTTCGISRGGVKFKLPACLDAELWPRGTLCNTKRSSTFGLGGRTSGWAQHEGGIELWRTDVRHQVEAITFPNSELPSSCAGCLRGRPRRTRATTMFSKSATS